MKRSVRLMLLIGLTIFSLSLSSAVPSEEQKDQNSAVERTKGLWVETNSVTLTTVSRKSNNHKKKKSPKKKAPKRLLKGLIGFVTDSKKQNNYIQAKKKISKKIANGPLFKPLKLIGANAKNFVLTNPTVKNMLNNKCWVKAQRCCYEERVCGKKCSIGYGVKTCWKKLCTVAVCENIVTPRKLPHHKKSRIDYTNPTHIDCSKVPCL